MVVESSFASSIQQRIASSRLLTLGTLCVRTSISPRLTSISSSSVRTTAWLSNASSSSPACVWISFTREPRMLGNATTSSPFLIVPETTVPAKPRKSWCGRITYCTGKRKSTRLRSALMVTVSRWCRTLGPSYHGMRSLFLTTLSPASALTGMKVMSWMSSLLENPCTLRRSGRRPPASNPRGPSCSPPRGRAGSPEAMR